MSLARRAAVGATVLGAVVAVGMMGAGSPDFGGPGQPQPAPLTYLALGDSVASGHGLGTDTAVVAADRDFGQPNGNCQRSSGNTLAEKAYTDLVDDALQPARFVKLACTGHTTADLLTYQVPAAARAGAAGGDSVVTVTAGANNYRFDEPATYLSLLDPRADAHLAWRAAIEATVRADLGRALAELGRGQPGRRILVTHYYNPYNDASPVFALAAVCGGPSPLVDCRARVAGTVTGLNQAISDAVQTYQAGRGPSGARAAVVGGVQAAFAGHESPRPFCGGRPPDAGASWVQSPSQAFVAGALLGQHRIGAGSDCVHPNPAGHRALARLVLDELAAP